MCWAKKKIVVLCRKRFLKKNNREWCEIRQQFPLLCVLDSPAHSEPLLQKVTGRRPGKDESEDLPIAAMLSLPGDEGKNA